MWDGLFALMFQGNILLPYSQADCIWSGGCKNDWEGKMCSIYRKVKVTKTQVRHPNDGGRMSF